MDLVFYDIHSDIRVRKFLKSKVLYISLILEKFFLYYFLKYFLSSIYLFPLYNTTTQIDLNFKKKLIFCVSDLLFFML